MTAPTQIDRYGIERELGRGAFGTVYRARHMVTGRAVALKVLHARHAGDTEMVERFFREARAAASTMSPYIVDVLDASIASDGSPFLALELLEGEDLEAHLETQGRLRTLDAIRFTREIAAGLDAAHRRGIVHRDLKPANVFLSRQSDGALRAKILDFGMSKLATPGVAQSFRTGTGAIMGTPLFMAPEQLKGGARDVDARADIYALGAMLYRMLTGRVPHEAETLESLLVVKLTQPAPDVSAHAPGLPSTLSHLVRRCLELDPERRPASCAEIERELADIERLTATPASVMLAPSVTSLAPSPAAPSSANRWIVPMLALGLVATSCVAGMATLGAGGAAVWAFSAQQRTEVGGTAPAPAGSNRSTGAERGAVSSPTPAPAPPPPGVPSPPTPVALPPIAPTPATPEPPAPDLGARVSVSALGRGASPVERGIADRALPALAQCRTAARERESMDFMWMGMGFFGGTSGLSYNERATQTETPVRDCIRDAIINASEPASLSGIVTFDVTLEPR